MNIFRISILAIVFVIPFCGILLFYSRIICKIREMDTKLVGLHARRHNRNLHTVAVMVVIVVSSTIICWAPITAYWIVLYSPK